MISLPLALVLLGATADPCGAIALEGGVVRTAQPLALAAPLPAASKACAKAIGEALKARKRVRSVTIAARLPVAQRVDGKGQKIADAAAQAVAAGGVPEARISTIVPAAGPNEAGGLVISYTERRARRPVARLSSASGEVKAGKKESKLKVIKMGDDLRPNTLVVTGKGTMAWLDLADGSRIKVLENSAVKLKRMYLNEQLARVVRMDLLRGDVKAEVRPGTKDSIFEISAGGVAAGVRGTSFRLGTRGGETKIETTEGLVVMQRGEEEVPVKAGFGLQVKKGQPMPKAPVPLPEAPEVSGPKRGDFASGALKWGAVDGATKYQVELARDAEFVLEHRVIDAASPSLDAGALKAAKGKWYWRVRAINAAGFSGATSKVYGFNWGG